MVDIFVILATIAGLIVFGILFNLLCNSLNSYIESCIGLKTASRYNNLKKVKTLIEAGANVNDQNILFRKTALINAGADVNHQGGVYKETYKPKKQL